MDPVTIIPLPGPDCGTIYMCPCGNQFEAMTTVILCALSHGEREESMSIPFRDRHGYAYAEWTKDGGLNILHGLLIIPAEDISSFAEALSKGPPKKQYRITRTFDTRPDYAVAVEDATRSRLGNESWTPLADSDIEEVWE